MPKTKAGDALAARKELGDYIYARSRTLGYKQSQVASKLHLSVPTLRSRLKNPQKFTMEQINIICNTFDLSREYELRLRGVAI